MIQSEEPAAIFTALQRLPRPSLGRREVTRDPFGAVFENDRKDRVNSCSGTVFHTTGNLLSLLETGKQSKRGGSLNEESKQQQRNNQNQNDG